MKFNKSNVTRPPNFGLWRVLPGAARRRGRLGRQGGCRNLPSESSGPDGPDDGSTHDEGAASSEQRSERRHRG